MSSIILNMITCVMVILSFVMFLRGEKRIIRRINESEDMIYKFGFTARDTAEILEKSVNKAVKALNRSGEPITEEKRRDISDDIDSVMKYSPSPKQRMKQKREAE